MWDGINRNCAYDDDAAGGAGSGGIGGYGGWHSATDDRYSTDDAWPPSHQAKPSSSHGCYSTLRARLFQFVLMIGMFVIVPFMISVFMHFFETGLSQARFSFGCLFSGVWLPFVVYVSVSFFLFLSSLCDARQ